MRIGFIVIFNFSVLLGYTQATFDKDVFVETMILLSEQEEINNVLGLKDEEGNMRIYIERPDSLFDEIDEIIYKECSYGSVAFTTSTYLFDIVAPIFLRIEEVSFGENEIIMQLKTCKFGSVYTGDMIEVYAKFSIEDEVWSIDKLRVK